MIETIGILVCKCGSVGADGDRGGRTRCGRNGSTNMQPALCPITRHRATIFKEDPPANPSSREDS